MELNEKAWGDKINKNAKKGDRNNNLNNDKKDLETLNFNCDFESKIYDNNLTLNKSIMSSCFSKEDFM